MDNQTYSFRSALSGFNRADVIAFIAQLSASQEAALRERDEALRVAREELERLRGENDRLLRLAADRPEAKPEELPAEPAPAALPTQEEELEAYRRAERCEREARTRAEKLYADAAAEVDGAGRELRSREQRLLDVSASLADDISSLQSAMADVCEYLSGARTRMQGLGQDLSERG